MIKRAGMIAFLHLGLNVSAYAEDPPPFQATLQAITNAYLSTHKDKEGITGLVTGVLIPRDKGPEKYKAVAGDRGFPPFNQAISSDNLFQFGSITKSFVAVIILQLEAENKLKLDDTLGRLLPEYKNWKEVTVTDLLEMTSGIPNYSENPDFLKILYGDLGHQWTNKELVSYASPDKPLKPDVQKSFEYCNTNYILAAMIIEKLTQDTFANQLKKRILNPQNGLANTYYPAGAEGQSLLFSLMPNMIHGYYYDKSQNKMVDITSGNLSWAGAAGAIVGSMDDLLQWVQLLYHGRLLPDSYRSDGMSSLEDIVSMKSGDSIDTVTAEDPRGFGLGVGYYYDAKSRQRFWAYEGSTLGYRVLYLWKACNGVTTAVALNNKAGEGDPNSPAGDDSMEINLQMYQALIKQYPDLRCDD